MSYNRNKDRKRRRAKWEKFRRECWRDRENWGLEVLAARRKLEELFCMLGM